MPRVPAPLPFAPARTFSRGADRKFNRLEAIILPQQIKAIQLSRARRFKAK
jgi:hypothetical protein